MFKSLLDTFVLLFSAATDLFLLRQLQHLHMLLKITCILCISLDPYVQVISFHLSPILLSYLAGFPGARYIIEFVMTYGVVWIIFLNVSLLYTIYHVKQMAHVNVSNLLWII